jgi:hypothetical protein
MMSSRLFSLLILLLLFQPHCIADPVSRALKALAKGKHEQVESVLNKSLEKHEINPGARYAYSMLYFDSSYVNYNLDSAHTYIEQALIDAQTPDSLGGLVLAKTSATIEQLIDHKALVDQTAFSRAAEQNTVESFQYFIDAYDNAPQFANAISRRDQLAFDQASTENTYQAYKSFMDQYPEALQFALAQERYNTLVFESKTANGKLQQFTNFLKEHPESPYRDQAEWQIFQLSTLDDEADSYLQFKKDYPGSRYAKLSDDILYHLDKELFVRKNQVSDSLDKAYELESTSLIPIYEKNHYGFIDHLGNDLIPPTFDSIPENYLCRLLDEDVLQAFVNDRLVLMSRNQKILWDNPYNEVKDIGRGLLQIKVGNKYGILHKSGWQVLDVAYDQIHLLGDSFLSIRKGNRWGITSMTGRIMVPPKFTSVENHGAFILMEDEQWAVTTKEHLIKSFEMDQGFDLSYQDWELISPHYLMVFSEDMEGMIDSGLKMIIPLSEHEIHELDSAAWFVKTAHGTVRFYGNQLQAIPADRYQDYVSNRHFIGLQRSPGWEVWDRSVLNPINENTYDSVATLGPDLMVLNLDGKSSVLFRNGVLLDLTSADRLKLIRDADQYRGFLQVASTGGKREIYDLDGNLIYETWYYDVNPLTENLFLIEKNGLKGIVDLSGEVLLKPRYQAIDADSASHISLLHRAKFGYFNPQGGLIKPQYESRLSYFEDGIMLSSKSGKKGLINPQNKVLLPFEYDEIKNWSDSMIFAKKGAVWQGIELHSGEIVYNNISGIEWIQGTTNRKAIIKTAEGYGLLDSEQGILLNPGFDDIINLGTKEEPVFFTEKYIPEADYYVVIYYNQEMDVIRKQVFDSGNYDQVYCF